MKSISNQLNKEIGISNLYGGVTELFHKEQVTNLPQEDNLLDNQLESNNLKRVIVPGDGNCCFLSVAHGLKEVTKETDKNHSLIAHLNSIWSQLQCVMSRTFTTLARTNSKRVAK